MRPKGTREKKRKGKAAPPPEPEPVQPQPEPEEAEDTIPTQKEDLLVEFMSRSTAASGSSYFGKYVEETLSKVPGEIRRDAEANIIQVLHRAQRAAEHSHMQPPPRQDQQSQQFQQEVPQFQHSLWQPHPSQWPPRPVGRQTTVWGSQDRGYIQRQLPTYPMTSPLPPTSEAQPGASGVTASTTTTALPSSLDDCFVSLLGASTPAAGSFNLSSQLNTPRQLADEDDDDTDLA
ncbi:uncharacterized protein LOC121366911 [Gigantopelta aegis]|uniref:uncharacterized protein LOC121366911 n=1 Tax=Gigantopelta aegis TaxID=1735272 RepID=UPI001B88CD98|nr:uncharacterized protein LOC121366911 [Gigantopelta aegis]